MMELRMRSRISDEELDSKVGKIVTDEDYNVLLTRDCKVFAPDGSLLVVYRRGAWSQELVEASYGSLHELKSLITGNRGLAGGTKRIVREGQKRAEPAKRVSSAIIGAIDPSAMYAYCRLTAWTGDEAEKFDGLIPLFHRMAEVFEQEVPERYEVQKRMAQATKQEWVIADTPFTTITVNNTYPTGVHTDKGDLDEGFSTLGCIRRGEYTGGVLVFPRYRIAVDMKSGDQVCMNAHEWHGNTEIVPGQRSTGGAFTTEDWDAERISVVAYYRTAMVACGDSEQEQRKAERKADQRSGLVGQVGLPL